MVHRLRDAGDFGGGVRFDPDRNFNRNPGDFVGHLRGIPLLFECKETAGDVLFKSKIIHEENYHQLLSMKAWVKTAGCIAGWLCHLGGEQLLMWVPVQAIDRLDSIRPGVAGSHGVRALDLSVSRVDWVHLFLGGNDGNSRSEASEPY